ncbi:acetyltransferase, GNAT family [Labilithrix luteola]|uniref:Acetyltransferase, GNAT family n=1 Tax=Labilithrix luteola TaxID=1391654 RepID=A0A0K1QBY1_9BACT|nr:GNAT family N-acetyltransferase [Labilithrix luteola]AKV03228.1 acetyltransferase, GNAT family [Labilithrix luteola]
MKIAPVTAQLRTGETVELRSPVGTDAGPVLTYVRELTRQAYRNLNHPPEYFEAMSVESEAAFLQSSAAHPKNVFIAAYLGREVVGTTNMAVDAGSFSAHCAELGLGVLAAQHSKGLGRLLLQTLIATARDNGVWNMRLRVRTFNEPAIALYESIGFRRVGVLHRVAKLPDGYADECVYQLESPPH